ncbi:MAG: acetyl/propionyl/methylcrotonyl-CoA carboxylase subunit alpha [Actinomycetota bacterium]
MIRKVLVANRGEVARRIFRTCRAMGIATVAVFSEADRGSLFVREAEQGFSLGGNTPAESYLRIDALVDAARSTGSDAIHPGYGFLAENAAFAQAVTEAGLTWIGPSPEAIAAMGSKLEAKRLVEAAGVPTLQSIDLTGAADGELPGMADRVGWPVLVKASAGGGGKGMRIVREPAELAEAVAGARRESAAAFGDDTVFLERYLEATRHIEIQIFGDFQGNLVSLFERECSIQRRHQKIVEEAPSTALDEPTRSRMGEAAVLAAKAVSYRGAGTVEFLFDNGEFYFLEMNTRLQVEHPVTEEITGLDLVRLQILVADGHPLPEEALDPLRLGHAVEVRLYAEDVQHGFLPVSGTMDRFQFPEWNGLRVESGVESGSEISPFYDPMVAKVIAWADTRTEAAALLASALQRAHLHGTTTNRDLLVRILRHPEFLAGKTDTHFLERHDPTELGRPLPNLASARLSAVAAALAGQVERRRQSPLLRNVPSGWRNSPSQLQQIRFASELGDIEVGYRFEARGGITVQVDSEPLADAAVQSLQPDRVGLITGHQLSWFSVNRQGTTHHVDGPEGYVRLVELPRFPTARLDEEAGSLHAPMPGRVVKVAIAEGDLVAEGQVLIVREAMKMEHSLRAPHAGTVRGIRAVAGDQVEAGEILVVVEP